MFRADKTITFVHREPSANAAVTGDRYTCTTVTGSWYERVSSAVTETGLKTVRTVKCRVPGTVSPALAALKRGDKFLKGTLDAADSAVFAALGRTHGAVTILDIHDNTDAVNGHYYFEGSD